MISVALPPNLEAEFSVRLDPRRWEDLIFDLVRRRHAKARQIRPPDGGADTLVPLTEETSHVFQAKFHPVGKRIVWKECEDSLDRAKEEHGALRVTFAFPRDLTKGELKQFKQRVEDRHPDVAVDRIPMGDFRDWLEEYAKIRTRYLGEAPEDSVEVLRRSGVISKKLVDGNDLVEHALELAAFGSGSDPDFTYEVAQGEGDLAEVAYPASLFMKMEMQKAEGRVRLLVKTREGHEPKQPQWWFAADEAGERAKSETRKKLARGEDVFLSENYTITVSNPPLRVKEIWDAIPDDFKKEGKGTIHLAAGAPVPLDITLRRGKTKTTRVFTLYRALPEAGADAALAGYAEDGVLVAYLAFRLPGPPVIQVSLTPLLDFGPNAQANLAAVQFIREFISCSSVTLRGPDFLPRRGMRFDHRGRDFGDTPERLGRLERLFAAVCTIERELHVELPLPDAGPSSEEGSTIFSVAEILSQRKGTGQFTEALVDVPEANAEAEAQRFLSRPMIQHPLVVDVLGQNLTLGWAKFQLPPVRILPIQSLVWLPDGSRLIHLRVIAVDPAIQFELVESPPSSHPYLVLPHGIHVDTVVTLAARAA